MNYLRNNPKTKPQIPITYSTNNVVCLMCIIACFYLCFFTACRPAAPSEEQYVQFGENIETALNNRDKSWIDGHFNTKFIVDKVTANLDAPDYYKDGFKEGFTNLYTPGTIMTSALGEQGVANFLKMKSIEPPIAFFRILSEKGVNYQEVSLDYDKNGDLYINDFYSLLEGEWFSQGIRRLYIINLAGEIEGFEHPLAAAAPIVDEVGRMADDGNIAEAFTKLVNVPKEVLKEKIVLLILLNLGQDLGQDSLKKAVNVYKELYPEDALVELKQMEFAYMNQDKANASENILAAIDQLENKIGEDPYLDILRGGTYLKEERLEEAQTILLSAIEKEPDNDEAYWSLIDLTIKTEQYDETIGLFQQFKEQFDENAADYILYDGYNEFYESPQYLKWIQENPLESNPNLKMDSIIQAVEEMLKDQEEDNHEGHNHP